MTQNIYITDLERALNDVETSYVQFNTYVGLKKDEKIEESDFFKPYLDKSYVDEYILQFLDYQKQTKEHSLERYFCSELYYTWKTIIKRNNSGQYKSLKLNSEISKTNLTLALKSYETLKNSRLFEKIKSNNLIDKTYFVPDLVLHGGHDNIDDQELIVEVKYYDNLKNGNFEEDFYKLAIYQKIFQFKTCVFLIMNITIKQLLEYLKKIDSTLIEDKGFWFIIKTENKIYTFNLNDLI
ncbi:hypothetical protein GKZ90_0014735 [Flavobacterium sp. MC2016-06]|jgi:hypothetical protein|uniref:hypothetical protein n=1 Tax=Flavobacterium sp. MC2016-06 TaxID=2676308 RepID=UPI0012BA7326|nr:hypothetical protein [Flavobacterium sp. MC2016-06]MBU3859276.1 hypothetical protein [Flavobacterium sp. MC2016-06]